MSKLLDNLITGIGLAILCIFHLLFWSPLVVISKFRQCICLKICPAILDWAKNQNIPSNTALELELPKRFRYLSQRGTVLALHTADGRYCILIKTLIHWKYNYNSIFYSDTPLSQKDACYYNVPWTECVSIKGDYQHFDINKKLYDEPGFKEMYVTKYHREQLLEVRFDLS